MSIVEREDYSMLLHTERKRGIKSSTYMDTYLAVLNIFRLFHPTLPLSSIWNHVCYANIQQQKTKAGAEYPLNIWSKVKLSSFNPKSVTIERAQHAGLKANPIEV